MPDDQAPRRRDCGTMQVHRRLLDTDPEYARRLSRIEEQAFRAKFSLAAMRPGCTRIPVVVHVVYKTAAQNISQDQIDSQIDVLNRDFRKANPDVANVPAPFAPLAGDARIEFALATTDPKGRPTDGVIRKKTDKDSFGSDDQVKFNSSGGSDAWPRDEYLNIWVCQLGGGLLGYAQFPGGPANTDGVVVTHTGFGTTGTAAAPFDKGRTATHEIGHWLNLRHIWGDDGVGCSGSDFVDDTPNQGGGNTGKPTFPSISCNNGPNGDMFMNYMDYVDDDTMVMFSEGQIQRMHACLDGPRSAIGASIPCSGGPGKQVVKDVGKDPVVEPGPKTFKEGGKDPIVDPGGPKGIKEAGKDPIVDPWPKQFKEPPKDLDPPKTIFEPPSPKSTMEPPFQPPAGGFPPFQPTQPATPFVMGTGRPPETGAPGQPQAGGAAQLQAQILGHYAQILGQYAWLHQRGMLDPQGLSAWQQVYAAYRQMGGQ